MIARPVVRAVRAVRRQKIPIVIHREYRVDAYRQLCETVGLSVIDMVFYNMKIFLRPLDRWFPEYAVRASEALERFARTPILRRLGTGFLIFARKR